MLEAYKTFELFHKHLNLRGNQYVYSVAKNYQECYNTILKPDMLKNLEY